MNDQERRKDKRYDRAFEIRYSPKKNASQVSYTVSKNISKSGICIPAKTLKDGDLVKLDIDLNSGRSSISTVGKVVWIKNIRNRLAPLNLEAGLKFAGEDTATVESFIRNIS